MKNVALPFFLGLVSCTQIDTSCEIKSLKMIETHEKVIKLGTGVEHFILADIKRDCLDSSSIVNAAFKYRDTIGTYKYEVAMPANILRFYSSDKDFVVGEAKSNDKKLNKNCLVVIAFGYNNVPNQYVFYNENGDVIYSGNNWLR